VTECPPDEDGFFADSAQCDKYYQCKDGELSEHLCDDGYVFDESSTTSAICSYPFAIDCTGREELQPAKPSKGCVRQNGYFPHPDTCEKYNYCVNGAGNTVPCAGGLIFDPNKGVCDYPDQVERKEECLKMKTKDAEDGEFQCPQNSSPFVHTRHPDPEDCGFFFLCVRGDVRRNKCDKGLVFSPETLACVDQELVEGPCHTWFDESYLESLRIVENEEKKQQLRNRNKE